MYAGKMANGFKSAMSSGKTFDGRYDELERFEIDDSKSVINQVILQKLNSVLSVKLKDILRHPELYKNYPVLANLKITSIAGTGATFILEKNQIGIGTQFDGATTEAIKEQMTNLRYSIILELQRAVQVIEGFDGGVSHNYAMREILEDEVKKRGLKGAEKIDESTLKYLDNQFQSKNFHSPGEIECRDVTARMNLNIYERASTRPYSSEGIQKKDTLKSLTSGGFGSFLAQQKLRIKQSISKIEHTLSKNILVIPDEKALTSQEQSTIKGLVASLNKYNNIYNKDFDKSDKQQSLNSKSNHKYSVYKTDSIDFNGVALSRIIAIKDIPDAGVKKGDLGGYIAAPSNLSQSGNCWIGPDVLVVDAQSRITGNALVSGAVIISNSRASDEACIKGKYLKDAAPYLKASRIVRSNLSGDAACLGRDMIDSSVKGNVTLIRNVATNTSEAPAPDFTEMAAKMPKMRKKVRSASSEFSY